MADVLLQPEFCPHNDGMVIADGKVECGGCGTEMVWVPTAYLKSLRRTHTERERELQRSLNVKTQALLRIRQYLREMGID